MYKILTLFTAICILMSQPALAQTAYIEKHVPDAQKLGSGRLSVLLWDVYDATLYTSGTHFNSERPFALKLNYLLDLKGVDIAERAVDEMRKQGLNDNGVLNQWSEQMKTIFPDVKEGDSLTGIRNSQGHALFYFNEKYVGSIKDTRFANHFFDIWLGKKTSEPELRNKLLGTNE